MFNKKTSVILTKDHAKIILKNEKKFASNAIIKSFVSNSKKVLKNPNDTFSLQLSVKELDLLYHLLSGETRLKNPISSRTAKLRASGEIKPTEWIGGNEFHQVKPKQNKFLLKMQEREKYGQQRLFNPKRKKNPSKTYDLGNNEKATIGVFKEKDGTFQALTFTKSKYFKTLAGAKRWFLKHGGEAAKKLLGNAPKTSKAKEPTIEAMKRKMAKLRALRGKK